MKKVKIVTEYIELEQLLKWAGIAGTGSAAKNMIKNSEVKVNGETELRRGKKVRPGDIVDVGDTRLIVE